MIFFFMILAIFGCATAPSLTREQVLQSSSFIRILDQRMGVAKKNGVDILAPHGFKSASEKLSDAFTYAYDQNLNVANETAKEGLQILEKAETVAESSRSIMQEVLRIRERAIRVGAPNLYPEEMADWENKFLDTTTLIERGDAEKAKDKRPALLNGYSNLELLALKKNVAKEAEASIAFAKDKEADEYAPKTLKQAERELDLAQSVLEANRTDLGKADEHAQQAIELANRSVYITALAKDFERGKYSLEDIVLWHQQDLSAIATALNYKETFDKANQTTVSELGKGISTLAAKATELQNKLLQLTEANQKGMEKIRNDYNQELTAQSRKQEEIEQRNRRIQSRLESVQALFNEDEAVVYRQKNNLLIVVRGFYFPSGDSEIHSSNFPLLKKIAKAISSFSHSKVVISGHTDSTGNPKLNLAISKIRAAKVAKFLYDVEGVDPQRLSTEGYGKEKPIATNDTSEGRALNRRIEVLIMNVES